MVDAIVDVKEILAIIPARGNSKGIPRKNMIPLCGKPLLQWALESTSKSNMITRSLVSSEDDKILQFCRKQNFETIRRPADLSQDNSTSESVIMHVLKTLKKNEDYNPDIILLLQATSPLRTAIDIDNAIHFIINSNGRSLISGYIPDKHPLKTFIIGEEKYLLPISKPEYPFMARQVLPIAFNPDGAIYITYTTDFLLNKTFYNDHTIPFYLDNKKKVDIDSIEDLKIAEQMIISMNTQII